ncbi:tetratricopeptide repeat protein [Lihuaxuella thermophila]|uniref:Tetratricopeptide repeat-containing protein n=1 Tax=Lihuaxuella thermophila TaxID=1173111 RepID=A0A1H8ITS2_9BACL|nr:hypothetical protein [Lihuaxuella thermophila]SEN71088.1 hypothetical protein SAMN05444955_11914 [Lihuaxuella thermophila]
MQQPDLLNELKNTAWELVGYRLPKETFNDFSHPNNRLLIGVTCLRAGYADVAYQLFDSVAGEGPKENPNHHFAYVRSLVEMAEIDAERGQFERAEELMKEALKEYPESMGYMMSRVHLEVYLAYYQYHAGKKEAAHAYIQSICEREKERFAGMPRHDAVSLVGPGLCYAIHQWALFYAVEGDWARAVDKFKEMLPYAAASDAAGIQEADALLADGDAEQAFYRYVEAVRYKDGE